MSSTKQAATATEPAATAATVTGNEAGITTTPVAAGANTPAAILLPEAGWDQWDVYESALRPRAAQSVDVKGMTQYHMAVNVSADVTSLSGAERIRYANRSKDTLNEIYLHLFPNLWHNGLTVSDVLAGGQAASTSLEVDDSLLRIQLQAPLAPGSAVEVSLQFREPIPQNGDVGNYGDFAYENEILALAQFYPTVAVYDGEWHRERPSQQGDVVFNQASLYDVSFTAPVTLTVVASGKTMSRKENGDGTATWRLAGGPMRDFNVVASPRFEMATGTSGGVTINSYFLPEDRAGGQQVLNWASRALATYQADFGDYPYSELDVAETSTTAGGIEYPGLVVVARNLYESSDRSDFFEGATVHEVAHQWWYNTVGNDQVNTPWLDEAMAQYSAYLYYQAAYGPPGAQGFEKSLEARWARVNNESKPIGLPVGAYEGDEYGAIVYGRGPLFLLTVQDTIGEDTMMRFLRQYYQTYAWQIAKPADFQALLQSVSGQDLSGLFKEWVYPPQ